MRIDLVRNGVVLIASIQGELDLSTSPLFREKIEAELDRHENLQHLILDLKETAFVDSSGLGAILGRFNRISKRGGKLAAVNLPAQLRKVFELSGLLKVISIHSTTQDALQNL